MKIPNLAYLRNIPDFGAKLYEALDAVQRQSSTVEKQVNGNATGQPESPPNIDALNVTGQNGHFNIAITDNGQVSRGIRYYVEHDSDPNFTNPHVIHMGDSRNHNAFLGNQSLYFRAFSAYGSSPPSHPAYHGSAAAPQPVQGGGSVGAPARLPSQGSGTGAAGVGLSGPGPVPKRDPATGVGWIQQRTGVSGAVRSAGSSPQQLAVIGGAGAQVGGPGSSTTTPSRIVTSASTTLSDVPPGLGAGDAGLIYENTFFARSWKWNGSAWHYADSGIGAGGQVSTSGPAPSGGLWTPCNGVAVLSALDNATTAMLTPSNTAAVGADNPMIEGGAGGAQQVATVSVTGNDTDAGITFLVAGVGSTAAINPHVHPIAAPSEAAGGLALRVSLAHWMRR
jgi:hypothetical protein